MTDCNVLKLSAKTPAAGMLAKIRKSRLVKDGFWVLTGQAVSALGTLAGVRVLTEYAEPQVYGALALYIGATALGVGTLVSPVMQALLRYYPEYASERLPVLRATIFSIISRRLVIGIAVIAFAAPLLSMQFGIDGRVVLLCALLLVLDGLRTLETTLLNAARRQTAFALIAMSEAWGRPFLAVLSVTALGSDIVPILTGYVLATALILSSFYVLGNPVGASASRAGRIVDATLTKAVKGYSMPLIPMSALGWMNGVGDRYLIGALLGLEQAGIYAAVYGLLSRPFLMISGVVELTLRPVYNQLVADLKHGEASQLLGKWLVISAALVGAGFIGVVVFDDMIVRLLLAEKYRSGVALMLWIAGGYVLLALSDVFVKVCYAYGYTGRILLIQIVGGVLGVVMPTLGILKFGLLGAAMAVPCYFVAMLIITVFASRVSYAKPTAKRIAVV